MPPRLDPWPYWTGGTASATGATGVTNIQVWQHWVDAATTTTTMAPYLNAASSVWEGWSEPAYAYAPPDPKQIWEEVRNRLIGKNRARVRGLRMKAAARVAEALLLDSLTDDQAAEYRRLQRFHLIVGDRTYRIRKGMHGNIDVIEDDTVVERLCVYARGGVPAQDNMLAQKLNLETDEEHLRSVANITRMRAAA